MWNGGNAPELASFGKLWCVVADASNKFCLLVFDDVDAIDKTLSGLLGRDDC